MFLLALGIGLLLLVGGAELLVRGGSRLAFALRVPALIVGLTVVALGTSMPELAVSTTAALRGSTDLALANVTGSNIANIAFVLGLAAMVYPIHVPRGLLRRELPMCLGLQVALLAMAWDGGLSRGDGLLLLAAGLGFNGWLAYDAMRGRTPLSEEVEAAPGSRPAVHVGMIVLGVLVLLVGAHLFVGGAVETAQRLGMSERFIGLTVVALGTSAPEIATGVVSSWRREPDIALGNSLGSNVMNITVVLALTAIVHPITIGDPGAIGDLWVALAVTAVMIPFVLRDSLMTRFEGAGLAGGYLVYLLIIG